MAKSKSRSKSKAKPQAKPEAKSEPEAQPAPQATAEPAAKPAPAVMAASVSAPPAAAARPARGRRIVWLHVSTVISATILIGAEVFGAAFAGSWALATLFGLGFIGARVLDIVLMLCGVAVMVQFVRSAHLIEPFTAGD